MAVLHDNSETKAEKIRRLSRELKVRRAKRGNLLRRAKAHAKRIKLVRAALKRLRTPSVPANNGGWHARAIRNQVQGGIGAFLNVPAKLVWHTTEGTSLPGYQGSHPHFTLDFKRRLLYQHIPVTSGAMALKNLPGGVETNRANVIQVELVGFAQDSSKWSDSDYAQIADLARWIEKYCGVKRQSTVTFRTDASHKVPDWLNYAGHLGHQHVPENDHWDPGLFQIQKVI